MNAPFSGASKSGRTLRTERTLRTSQSISNNEEFDILCSNCSQDVWLDIDYVTVGTQTVQAEGPATLLDLGVDEEAFDWLNISKPTSGVMNEPGALRFVVGSNAFSGNYDANGNLINRIVNNLATIMSYDAENRLVSVIGAVSAAFVYDGDGNRVKSTISGGTTAFIGNHTEWDVSSSSLTRYYYAGSTRVAMRKNNTVYYMLSDHLGSTSITTDENGQNLVKQLYLPWGEVRYSSGSLPTKYTYTGQYSNVSDFGLLYYNARWYDSALSRFTSADTIVPQPGNPLDWDRYSYVRNNPIYYTDPSGHKACDEINEYGQCFSLPEPPKLQVNPPPLINNQACTGENLSALCLDPTLIEKGSVQTNIYYPIYQTPRIYEGPFSDEKCGSHPICLILVIGDLANFLHYQTNLPARINNNYIVGVINYEVHRNQFGNYTTIPSINLLNETDSTLSLSRVEVNNKQLIPKEQFLVEPRQFISANMPDYPYIGNSAKITLQFISDLYISFGLNASFP